MLRRTFLKNFAGSFGTVAVGEMSNERMDSFAPGSKDRAAMEVACATVRATTLDCPIMIDGKEFRTTNVFKRTAPSDHSVHLATGYNADKALAEAAVKSSLQAHYSWSRTSFQDRCAVILKAAHLITAKYRAQVQANTMLGQSKNAWQAEIDCVAEAADFLRFNVKYAQQIYAEQPLTTSNASIWNMTEYRPLEGFVAAVSPFNFTAIGVNLALAPVLMGNTVIWKPSPNAILSSFHMYKIFEEAGLPAGVINFVPCEPDVMSANIIEHPMLGGVAFTGSTNVFNAINKTVAQNLGKYRSYPRISGETGGKNFHFLHPSCDVNHAAAATIRSAFEYQGQKCSACSRLYCPKSLWPQVEKKLLEAHSQLVVGQPDNFKTFVAAVIDEVAFNKNMGYIAKAKAEGGKVIAGGTGDNTEGYFIQPTIIVTSDPKSVTMREEIFGPVLTVFVYEDSKISETLTLVDETTPYALTGGIFAADRAALRQIADHLRFSAGNIYINDKSTGAVVGQQPFGGGRLSGSNDKPGASQFLHRWISARTIKENFDLNGQVSYPHQLPDNIIVQ